MSKAKVISFINEKGGTGKSSVCFNLAWELSKRKKILIIDLDGQRANITFFCGISKQSDTLSMMEVLQGGRNMKDAIVNVRKNLDIVPGTINTANITQTAKIGRFRKELETVEDSYDYVFIDVNPTPTWCHVLALSVSDYCMVVMLPDIASLEAVNGIRESIEEITGYMNPTLKVAGLVFNKYNPRTNLSRAVTETSERIAEKLDSRVFKAKIRNAVVLSECIYENRGVTEYAPNSKAAEDYVALGKEFKEVVK